MDVSAATVTIQGAETPADADATPTNAAPVQGFLSVYNGTTWDLVREGTEAGSLRVGGTLLTDIETNTDFGAVVGHGAAATALRVTVANDSTGTLTVDLGTNNDIQGAAAHDSPVSGNPLLMGGYATNSIEGITEIGAGDAARLVTDLKGVMVTRTQTTLEEINRTTQTVTTTTSTAATNFGAPGAGDYNYITAVTVYNSSSTDTFVRLQDGNGGSDIWVFPAPQTGGTTMVFDPPLKQTTAATALYFAAGAAVTTMYVSILGFQAGG